MQLDLNLLFGQLALIFLLIAGVFWFIKINKTIEIERRYRNFCLEPLNNNDIPLSTKLTHLYDSLNNTITKVLSNSAVAKDYSKKYEKYVVRTKGSNITGMNFIATKFIFAIAFIVLIILSDILRYESITMLQLLTSFLIGFFIPDIYWHSKNKLRKIQIEKDMLKAIIIMNNSFKSGLSIMQAIYMVSNELEGPISEEFRKMYIDISFGLDMDIVFERFAKRVNTEEAYYITTSLSVLNKTGGNIVQVFASVERSAFTRKKLKEELEALSASANAIYKILICIPIFFALIIFLLRGDYFLPLITTSTGRLILILILLIYFSYIFIVNRIVKMKE